MLVIPGAEVTQNRIRAKKNAHIIALDVKQYISADQSPEEILLSSQLAELVDAPRVDAVFTLSCSRRRAPGLLWKVTGERRWRRPPR